MSKDNNSCINTFRSSEQLEKFVGKLCVFNLTFLERPITGRITEVNNNFILLEMKDGRLTCVRMDTILGFAMAKKQYPKPEAV